MSDTVLMECHKQWASRPNDQRYLTLQALKEAVQLRKEQSWTTESRIDALQIPIDPDSNDIEVKVFDRTSGQERTLSPSHFAFGQLCTYAKAPAGYLRQLPPPIAQLNLDYGLRENSLKKNGLILAQTNGENTLRALTSTSYGRIWDIEVVQAVENINQDGKWQIPAASYATTNPLRATTLYASDRDVFVFLVDPNHPIEIPGEKEPMFRGFFCWNSEVGSATFGITTFLYSRVCDNRMIWGATDIKELSIRHTGGAPERFAYEGEKYLNQYTNESPVKLIEQIKRAQDFIIPTNKEKINTVVEWLQTKKFSKSVASKAVIMANAESGRSDNLWSVINGITAYARSIPHTNERVELEESAGKLMNLVA